MCYSFTFVKANISNVFAHLTGTLYFRLHSSMLPPAKMCGCR